MLSGMCEKSICSPIGLHGLARWLTSGSEVLEKVTVITLFKDPDEYFLSILWNLVKTCTLPNDSEPVASHWRGNVKCIGGRLGFKVPPKKKGMIKPIS